MDIEEQIEKAEKLDTPSLVGSSIRSADDSIHQNYIHPEKYKGSSKTKPKKHSILDSSIGASLDDLISEGALLGSEEDFDRFLDDSGHVKSDARYTPSEDQEATPKEPAVEKKKESPLKHEVLEPQVDTSDALEEATPISAVSTVDDKIPAASKDSLYETENYSAPNLSEYQLEHQISSHSDLLDSVKSYDLSKLPSSTDRERSKTNTLADSPARVPLHARPSAARTPSFNRNLDYGENANVRSSDSLHTPYFPSYERSPSRSRASARDKSTERRSSRSSSTHHPHLARGDTYKSTHPETPLKYELPADIDMSEESGDDDRATRHSRPTMGESIAAAEQQNLREFHGEEGITRDPSLVTTGDYTNFNVDTVSRKLDDKSLYSVRSESATNYLRSISRSRSRQPRKSVDISEKNDANPEELAHEGALISDDPFDQVENFDNVMKNVVSPTKSSLSKEIKEPAEKDEPSQAHVTDVAAEEKDEETKEQLLAEKAKSLSAKDIHVDASSVDKTVHHEFVSDAKTSSDDVEESPAKVDESAEEKIKEAREQLIAEEAPTVTAADIKVHAASSEEDAEKDAEKKTETASVEEPEVTKETQTEAEEAPVEESEEKSNLVTEPSANVSEEQEAKDIKAEELPNEEEAKPTLVEDEGLQAPAVEATEALSSSVDESGNAVEEKEESADTKNIETDEHGAKVPKIDFDAEKTEASLEENEEAVKTSLLGETANDDKALEVEDIEATEVATDAKSEPKSEPVKSEAAESETLESKTESVTPAVETKEVEGETKESEETAEEESKPKVVDAPEGEGEVIETKEEAVPSEEEQVKATEIVAGDEKEDAEKSDKADTVEQETKEVANAEEVKSSEESAGSKEVSEKVDEAETSKSPASASKGWFGSIKEGISSVVGGGAAAETAKEATGEDDDLDVSPEELKKHLQSLPVYIFTSLAGGMQIMQKTNRLATILQANGVKFEYRDLGTDEEAKKLWRRYAQGKTLPGVVRGDDYIGNWQEVDELNEEYMLTKRLWEEL